MTWLLEDDQPSARYLALTELLGRAEDDPEVREARARIPETGWAADILAERNPEGWWADEKSLYLPKYLATNWQLLMLSDLGLTRDVAPVGASCELWMRRFAAKDGGLGGNSGGTPHHCLAGNMARALIRFGYADDSRV
ncbi:MAG: nitrogen fixation protein NifH, partial [Thermoplasmata archaeon]